MPQQLPYCGSAPVPGELLTRFNLDPILLAALVMLAVWHVTAVKTPGPGRTRVCAAAGWLAAAAAFVSPLCALSVSLFSARVAQHMVIVLVAAPLLAQDTGWAAPPGTTNDYTTTTQGQH